MSAAAVICAFAFLLLPKFFLARRDAVPPITIDLFLSHGELLAAPHDGIAVTAKRHGLTAIGNSDHPKLGVGDGAASGTATLNASGPS
jgi:hypothetical protein